MDEYMNNIIDGLPNDMKRTASTPPANHLREINVMNPINLPEDDAIYIYIHHLVAKLQFLL
jgi:hypothetical protein